MENELKQPEIKETPKKDYFTLKISFTMSKIALVVVGICILLGIFIYSSNQKPTYIQKDDVVNISYQAFDGETEIPEYNAQDLFLTVGKGSIIEEIDNSLLKHNSKDVYDVKINFAEDFIDEQFAGKEITFKVTVNAVYDIR